jgi:hypothetical protein
MCVLKCVCVCVREREREMKECEPFCFLLSVEGKRESRRKRENKKTKKVRECSYGRKREIEKR